MKLVDIIAAIVGNDLVSDKDIEETVLYLTEATQDAGTLKRIVKKLNKALEYEEAEIG